MSDDSTKLTQQADYARILEQVGAAVVSIDQDGQIHHVNQAAVAMFGHTVADMIGNNVSMLMPDQHARNHDRCLNHHMATGEHKIIGKGRQVEGLKADGSVFIMHLSVGKHEYGGETYFTGIVHDLTEQERARKRLLTATSAAQKAHSISKLCGGIAHDFNNYLTVITGNLELLEMKLSDASEHELLIEARKAAESAANLTDQLLGFAQQRVLSVARLSINDAILDLTDQLRQCVGESVTLHTILAPDLWAVSGDLTKIDSSLLNMALNARDAMPDGGRLTIETRNHTLSQAEAEPLKLLAGDYAELIVTDTGRGIDPTHMGQIFDPFFTTKSKPVHQGLGLSTVYGFARQLGGYLRVDSTFDKGAKFSLLLPRVDSKANHAVITERSGDAVKNKPSCILLVEDDDSVRRLTTKRLLSMGHSVIEAANAGEALVLFCDHPEVELLFTDMVMPGNYSGWDLSQQILERSPSLPVIISSGFSQEFNSDGKTVDDGMFILQKPYTTDELADVLSQALQHYH